MVEMDRLIQVVVVVVQVLELPQVLEVAVWLLFVMLIHTQQQHLQQALRQSQHLAVTESINGQVTAQLHSEVKHGALCKT
jgi:tRNA A-37 threonylcarbamoyl transferase component Bud32